MSHGISSILEYGFLLTTIDLLNQNHGSMTVTGKNDRTTVIQVIEIVVESPCDIGISQLKILVVIHVLSGSRRAIDIGNGGSGCALKDILCKFR